MLPLDGPCIVKVVPAVVNERGTNRWFSSKECVTEPRAISDADAIRAASGVVTENDCPTRTEDGAVKMAGRVP